MIEREREREMAAWWGERERGKRRHDRKIEMGRKRTTRQGRTTAVEVREKC